MNPGLSSAAVRDIVAETAENVEATYDASGHSPTHGYGRVNACAAAAAAAGSSTVQECEGEDPHGCPLWLMLLLAAIVALIVALLWSGPLWKRLLVFLVAGILVFILVWLLCAWLM